MEIKYSWKGPYLIIIFHLINIDYLLYAFYIDEVCTTNTYIPAIAQ